MITRSVEAKLKPDEIGEFVFEYSMKTLFDAEVANNALLDAFRCTQLSKGFDE